MFLRCGLAVLLAIVGLGQTNAQSGSPTGRPAASVLPTVDPTAASTLKPTRTPTLSPTSPPTTIAPTGPTATPSFKPSSAPTKSGELVVVQSTQVRRGDERCQQTEIFKFAGPIDLYAITNSVADIKLAPRNHFLCAIADIYLTPLHHFSDANSPYN